ncbi:hypothetical protein F5B19DRAFT_490301 [Rostrohypoxylon terebratum]|nr:hypothetical protein F5B19DRAFT_490301 [Rostrohypoxylon terebratum]
MAAEFNHQLVRLTASQAQTVKSALQQWSKVKLINPDLVPDLLTTIQIIEEGHGFPWQKVAKYAFRLAILSLIVAIFGIIFDDVLPKLVKKFLDLPIAVRLTIESGVAIMVHTWGYQRSLVQPEQRYLNEAIHCVGAFVFALAALDLASYLESDKDWNRDGLLSILIGLASIYGLVAATVNSTFIWSFGIILLGIWFGSISDEAHYLGHRYPARFVLLGIATICGAYLMQHFQFTIGLWKTTRIWGMLYLFNSLWLLSLFDSFLESFIDDGYKRAGSRRVLSWSLAFFFAAAFSLWHGLQFRDSATHGFGLLYLSINLYTKFYEFCWDSWYSSVFFAVLALSLALLGRYAEHMNIFLTNGTHTT